jgi:SAM-dependent methyltransferase
MKSLFSIEMTPCGKNAEDCECGRHGPKAKSLTVAIQERYAKVAERGASNGEMGTACCDNAATLYSREQLDAINPQAAGASAGCGNPVGIADVKPGETVLDLGSGGGIDCFLAAKAAGPEGHVYGVDMTNAMVALARENAGKLGVENVTFLLGQIEALPMPDASVDLVISNCVIALAPDKDQVFREIHRVLKPGGRFIVSDIVSTEELPESAREDAEEWVSCVGGADLVSRYLRRMTDAGFNEPETLEDKQFGSCGEGDAAWREYLRSVTVRAFKPS